MSGNEVVPAEVTDYERRLLDFLRSRGAWLAIKLYEVGPGTYDIALRLDGTYDGADIPEELAQYFRNELGQVVPARSCSAPDSEVISAK
jgi:hypothetical protein